MPIKRTCLFCDKEFYVRPSIARIGKGKYCSIECCRTDKGIKKVNSKTIVECEFCGIKFEAWNCRLRKGCDRFCSRPCVDKWLSKDRSGENHPSWQGGKPTLICVVCGKEFQSYPDKRRKERKLCSKTCLNKWQETSLKGENNPNWKNGISTENNLIRTSAKYEQWKTRVFERDNYTCVRCMKRGGDLNAHHILLFVDFPEERFELSNGATLCIPCHDWIHANEINTSNNSMRLSL